MKNANANTNIKIQIQTNKYVRRAAVSNNVAMHVGIRINKNQVMEAPSIHLVRGRYKRGAPESSVEVRSHLVRFPASLAFGRRSVHIALGRSLLLLLMA